MAEGKREHVSVETIRKQAGEAAKRVSDVFDGAGRSPILEAAKAAVLWIGSALVEIAAQLAEANERDREAEIRAKNAEEFVAGIQAEMQRLQGSGLISPVGIELTPKGPQKR